MEGPQTALAELQEIGSKMPNVPMTEYEDAAPEVRAVYDEILAARGAGQLSDFWKTLAFHPPTLRRNWENAKEALAPGALDALTKEMVYIAASVATNCDFCTEAHIALARRLGMTDAMFGELMAVVALANGANSLVTGYGVVPERRRRPPE